jgi:hypothetical protein
MVQGGLPTPSAYWHGHEMVFGYAFAVVSGYLLTRVGRIAVGLLFASWLAARLAALGLLVLGPERLPQVEGYVLMTDRAPSVSAMFAASACMTFDRCE